MSGVSTPQPRRAHLVKWDSGIFGPMWKALDDATGEMVSVSFGWWLSKHEAEQKGYVCPPPEEKAT